MRSLPMLCQFVSVLLFLTTSFSLPSSATQLCSHNEAAALIQFKSSLAIDETRALGVCKYPKSVSWKEGTDCCSWDGITCDNKTGQVIGLDLSCGWLYGTILSNASLFHLPHLQKLNLADNDFNGSEISANFGRFESLVYLNLSNSFFSGRVPSQISNLSKLVSLDLSWNYFQIHDKHTLEGLVHNLPEVKELFLDLVNISFVNPNSFMNLSSSLMSLSLSYCDLRGKFPEKVFHLPNLKLLDLGMNINLTFYLSKTNWSSHLEVLNLRDMFLSQEFLDSMANLVSLKHLDLSGTSSSRGLPESIGNLVSLESLDIVWSSFSAGLPDSIGNLVSLKRLDLSLSSFSGGLPYSIGNLASLEYLDLSFSSLSGRLPNSIGNLVSMKYMDLRQCNFSGSIPRSLSNLTQLVNLFLSSNHFGGQIPSSITNLKQLKFLDMHYNQLEGKIPDKVTSFPNLVYLDLSDNFLNGTIPPWLYTLSSLEMLHLENNQFTGPIKEFQQKSLESISFGNNKLQGHIPFSIFQLVNLTYLDLSLNNFKYNLGFDMFLKLQNLMYLDLSYNSLSLMSNTGVEQTLSKLLELHMTSCNLTEFPQFLIGSKGLQVLDMSNNSFYGHVPKWMWNVGKDSLRYLNLSHNSLTELEQIPWKNIEMLDLSSNLIQGDLKIPPLSTRVFLISNNNLSGDISSLICNRTSLEILDLSHNNLSGTIPQCFGNLSRSLWMLNLRMNNVSGTVPSFSKECTFSNLNLNGNQLEGPLTQSIINCRSLEVLDLGNNKINETFPHWLGTLPHLQVLVLQSNLLHGHIHGTKRRHSFPKLRIFALANNNFTGPLPVRYIEDFKAMNLKEDKGAMPYLGVLDGGQFYSYSVRMVVKGLETEMIKIFAAFTIIDLSNNRFQGEIPKAIGNLSSLIGLNLSHNRLNGPIPSSFGNLINLEWLDLSWNELDGKIPEQLVDVTWLSVLNLSNNDFFGRIPRGNQFNTFENTSYEGNDRLCGFPLSRDCSNDTEAQHPPPSNLRDEDDSKSKITFGWRVVVVGYACGLISGLAKGFVVFQTGKPHWIVSLVEGKHHQWPKKSKKNARKLMVGRSARH
ncbi:receptor-like protein 12 [Durio zibethinus]|uniref:Receptor-like protein 12 n=1 Tax=Durio zibethinus TaxID=66656 RepID=A0A6P6ALS3_DURZI|nr:receptor-like protein 12 [Durio zibethinus]